VYQHLKGVRSVLSGYAGGDPRLANYSAVTTGKSGHAESVEIVYDPAQVTYGQILHVFFSVVHDPTQKDRQGPDVGPQYRSAIFHADESQQKIAQAYIKQLGDAGVYGKPIVTRVEPLRTFHEAEGYHQDYLIRNPRNPYIVINDLPKVRSFEQMFPSLYVASPVTVAARGTARAASTRDPPAAKTSDPPGAMMMRRVRRAPKGRCPRSKVPPAGSTARRSRARVFAARWCSSTSGRIRASTACGPCHT
jgi:peptide-methionine (S)-S-oxide reductase